MAETTEQRVNRLMQSETIASFLENNIDATNKTRNAIEYLVEEHDNPSDQEILRTVWRFKKPLVKERITAFCSYKEKDKAIAVKLDELFRQWSADKLQINHMATFAVGKKWRNQIKKDIPGSDWFLLLMPGAEEERDWPLFEAGYFRPGGPTLSRRLVCLHHPDTEVTEALGDHQSIPAESEKVMAFLNQLLILPNWIPGLPAVNPALKDKLPEMAQGIIDLIKPPMEHRRCCGPHMRINFDEIKELDGWALLSSGIVKEANDDCKELFDVARDLSVMPPELRRWFKDVDGVGQDRGWVAALAGAVRAVGQEKRRVPAINTVLPLPEGRYVQPRICAVTRRKDGSLGTIDLLFLEAPSPKDNSYMSPEFSALATTMQFAVEFRSILEKSANRRPGRENMKDFASALRAIEYRAATDPRLSADPEANRRLTTSLFSGSDRKKVERMFDMWEAWRRPDGKGILDQALERLDAPKFSELLNEMLQMNQQFLEVVSARFSKIVRDPESTWDSSRDAIRPTVTEKPGKGAGFLESHLKPHIPSVLADMLPGETATDRQPEDVDPLSIAVLPFENLTDDYNDVFPDGMTEEVVSRLSRVEGLTVLSRYAVMDYKRTTKTWNQIAKELKTAYLLEGSVRREGKRVRITAQLINPRTRGHLWAKTYEKDLDNVFEAQSAVAEAIVAALDLKLSPEKKVALKESPTRDLAAYEFYLKGMRHYTFYRRDDNEKAIALWKQALAKDPEYALAHAGLSRAYYQRAERFGFPTGESLKTSLQEARRAVELDPELPEAYAALGSALGALGQVKNALEAELRAIELKPSDLIATMNAGVTYSEMGMLCESLQYKKRALALDPRSSNSYSQLGAIYALLEMDDEAQKRFQRAIELEPDTVQARAFLAQLYMAMGKDEKALEQAETILNLYPNEPMGLDAAGRAHWFAGQIYKAGTYFRQNMEQSRIALAQIAGSSGHQDEAEGLLAPLVAFLDQTLADGGEASWIYRKFAGIHAVRGEINKAYEYLDRAVEAGEVDYRTLQRLPVFDRMRAEQRFQDCMAAMRGRVEEMRTRVKLQEDG